MTSIRTLKKRWKQDKDAQVRKLIPWVMQAKACTRDEAIDFILRLGPKRLLTYRLARKRAIASMRDMESRRESAAEKDAAEVRPFYDEAWAQPPLDK